MELFKRLLNSPIPFDDRGHREKLVILICCAGIALISPFILVRYFKGEYGMALLDFAIVSGLILLTRHIWATRQIKNVCIMASAVATIGVTAVILYSGTSLVYWAYPTIMANFFLISRRLALAMNGVIVATVAFALIDHPVVLECILVMCTTLLLFIMGLVVTTIIDGQQLRLSRLATHDVLTGVMNRRSLDEELNQVYKNTDDTELFYTGVMMLDLDHFKQINDTFGHAAGDKVLKETARLVKKVLDGKGTLYRYGGEEFTILCHRKSLARSLMLADKIRLQLQDSDIFPERQITVSIGFAPIIAGTHPQIALQRADDALYQAKQDGRNRVAIYKEPAPVFKKSPSPAAQSEMSLAESA